MTNSELENKVGRLNHLLYHALVLIEEHDLEQVDLGAKQLVDKICEEFDPKPVDQRPQPKRKLRLVN